MGGTRVPQVGEVWVFSHFKREDQRRRSRVRVDMVTDEDVVFTYLRHGGEQTATTFTAFLYNYDFSEPARAGEAPVVAGVTTSQVPQTSLVADPPAPLEQVTPATPLAGGQP